MPLNRPYLKQAVELPFPRLDSAVHARFTVESTGIGGEVAHNLRYRSLLRRQIRVQVVSELGPDHRYSRVPSSDALSPDGRRWRHPGGAGFNGRARWTSVDAVFDNAGPSHVAGTLKVEATVNGAAPFAGMGTCVRTVQI